MLLTSVILYKLRANIVGLNQILINICQYDPKVPTNPSGISINRLAIINLMLYLLTLICHTIFPKVTN